MTIKLNLLTGRKGEYSYNDVEVNEEEFWYHYLSLLNVRNNFNLSTRELNILNYILSGEPDVSYFHGEKAKELKDRFNMKAPNLSIIKSQLILKGYIIDEGSKRGNAFLVPTISKYQKFVKRVLNSGQPLSVKYIFGFNVKADKDTKESE